MNVQLALGQLFAVCLMSAATEVLAGENASGVRAVCGLSVVLTVLRLAVGILG